MTISCTYNAHEPISDEWLKAIGFRWHAVERAPHKHWVLWLGDAVRQNGLVDTCDLGVELTRDSDGKYHCWLRGDYSHRYSRFIHVRHLHLQCELLRLIEGLTGLDWKPENVWYGSLVTDKQAAYFRKEKERLDVRLIEGSHPWKEIEKDESRGYPLSEHQRLIEGKE